MNVPAIFSFFILLCHNYVIRIVYQNTIYSNDEMLKLKKNINLWQHIRIHSRMREITISY
nr:MAG TPA_asm: hypothetical protein [Bacteriophage sp.]